MFAGIVTDMGTVRAARRTGDALALSIESSYDALEVGESVAVSGVCLTVVDAAHGRFSVDVIDTTRGRTWLGEVRVGDAVNLERALAVGDRIGGHFVQGHVDGLGTVTGVRAEKDTVLVDVRLPPNVVDVTVLHGSIAVDGVSMTVNALPAPGEAQIALIPHTRAVTTLGRVKPGDRVHIEGDMMGKLVRQMLQPLLAAAAAPR